MIQHNRNGLRYYSFESFPSEALTMRSIPGWEAAAKGLMLPSILAAQLAINPKTCLPTIICSLRILAGLMRAASTSGKCTAKPCFTPLIPARQIKNTSQRMASLRITPKSRSSCVLRIVSHWYFMTPINTLWAWCTPAGKGL